MTHQTRSLSTEQLESRTLLTILTVNSDLDNLTSDDGLVTLTSAAQDALQSGDLDLKGSGPCNIVIDADAVTIDGVGSMLTVADVQSLAAAATTRWIESGITQDQLDALQALNYQVADLGHDNLGQYRPGLITIDDNAGGNLWFVDATPDADEEFTETTDGLVADAGTLANGKMDLLTALIHEQAHVIGLHDVADVSDNVLSQTLQTGLRRLPIDGQAADAIPGSVTTVEYLSSGIEGSSQPFDIMHPFVTMNYVIATTGTFPSGNLSSEGVLGAVDIFAGNFAPRGYAFAHGQLLTIAQNSALFAILGTTYGGDGQTTFALPDLRGRTPIGAGAGAGLSTYTLGGKYGSETATLNDSHLPSHNHGIPQSTGVSGTTGGSAASFSNLKPSLALTPLVALQGVYPTQNLSAQDSLGSVSWFAGNFAPAGYAKAEGQLLQISNFSALFSLYGTTYGGDGQATFALPDLRGRMAVGYGTGSGLANVSLGQRGGQETITLNAANVPDHGHTIPNTSNTLEDNSGSQPFDIRQPYLGLNFQINLIGVFPSQNLDAADLNQDPGLSNSAGEGFISGDEILDEAEALALIDTLVQESITRWQAVGIDDAQIAKLQATDVVIGDLQSGRLALAGESTITLDRDASNRGWFIDVTPADDLEFGEVDPHTGRLLATDPDAANHYDLLSALLHEQGHILGLHHTLNPGSIMYGGMGVGGRTLPTASDLVESESHHSDHPYLEADPLIASVSMFGGNFAVSSWLETDGQILPISQWTALFSLLGTTYGGDGETTFGLPDTRGRAVVGAGSGPGLTPRTIGQRSGVVDKTLSVANIPSHAHTLPSGDPVANNDTGADLAVDAANGTVNVLANDTDPNGNPNAPVNGVNQFSVDLDLASAGVQSTFTDAQGVWTLDTASGDVTFDPADGFSGRAVATYTLTDTVGRSDNATITFNVRAATGDVIVNLPAGGGITEVIVDGTDIVVRRGVTELSRTPIASTTSLTINGTDADDDTLRIDHAVGNPVPTGGLHFNGGAGANDTLIVTSGSITDVEYETTGSQSGDIDVDGRTVTFEHLEPLDFSGGPLTNLAISVDPSNVTGSAVVTTISANGANTLVSFDAASGLESLEFGVLTDTLTINLDANDIDILNFEGLGTSFAGHIVINGDVLDTVNFLRPIDLGAGNLSVDAKQINVYQPLTSAGGNIDLKADDFDIQNTINVGAGDVTITPLTAGTGIDLGLQITGGASQIYWVDATTDNVQRADVSGTNVNVEEVVTATGSTPNFSVPTGIAVDSATGQVYFSDTASDFIGRADLAGPDSNVQTLVSSIGIANDVTVAGGKLYWIDANTGSDHIVRADLDGSNQEILVDGLDNPQGIAVDLAGGKVYWSDSNAATDHIRRADLYGGLNSNVQDVVTGLDSPEGIALDLVHQKIYFVDDGAANRIARADMNGTDSNVEDVVTGLLGPNGIAVDPIAGKVYWSDSNTGGDHLSSASTNISGGPNQNILEVVSGQLTPNQIALSFAAGNLTLTDAELNRITAGRLTIGDMTSGDVTITSSISPANITTLEIVSGGVIGDTNTTGSDITATNVILNGNVSLGNPLGILNVNGNFTPTGTVAFNVNPPSATAGTDFDQIVVNGTVDLSGATLAFSETADNGTVAIGQTLTLIVNDGADATIASGSLSEMSVVTIGANTYQISYLGGDGNDVTLTKANNPPELRPGQDGIVQGNISEDDIRVAGIGGLEITEASLTAEFDAGAGEGQTLSIASGLPMVVGDSITTPGGGVLTLESAGLYVYSPGPDFVGTDIIEYMVTDDGTPASANVMGQISITVTQVNDGPDLSSLQNISVGNTAGLQTIPDWFAGVTVGPATATDELATQAIVPGNTSISPVGTDFLNLFETASRPLGVELIGNDLVFEALPNAFGTATFEITVFDDGPVGGGDVNQSTRTFTITLNGAVSVAASPGSVAEDGAGNLEYTLTREDTVGELTVNFTLSGDATLDEDYTVSGATMTGNSGVVTFADGDATAIITIDPTADTTVELDETVELTVDTGTAYVVGTINTATATITNDDTATVSVGDVTMAEGDSGSTVFTFNVSLDNPVAEDVTFDFTTVSDTAVAGSDFTAISGTGVITAGETMTTIAVEVSGDTMVESDEQFFVDVSNLRASGLSVEFATRITQLGVFDTPSEARSVEVVGDVAYVADRSSGVVVLDISDPVNITQLGVFQTTGEARSVQVVGDVAYVADGFAGLVMLDVRDPANITQLGVFDTIGEARSVQVVGDVAYVADGAAGLVVLNISDPVNITEIDVFDTRDTAYDVEVVGEVAYVVDESSGVVVLDISDPVNITQIGAFGAFGDARSVQVVGGVAYVADLFSGLVVWDIRDPANINRLGVFDTPGFTQGVEVVGNVAYVAGGGTGLIVLNVDMTPSARATATITNDDTATVSVGDVTMAEGDSGSTVFTFNVSLDNPVAEDVTFDFTTVSDTAVAGTDFTAISGSGVITAGETMTTIDVEVSGGTTVERDEQFFVDVSNLRASGLSVEFAPASISQLGVFDTTGTAFGVEVVGDVAYVADQSVGLVVLDISDPANIIQLGVFETTGTAYAYDVEVVGDVAYVAYFGTGLVVLDVSDPANITQLEVFDTPGIALGVEVVGDVAYVADGVAGLVVLNISEPANITQLGVFDTPGLALGVEVVGDVAYVADQSAGLVVLDIREPANITRLGVFDTTNSALGVQVVGDVAYVADGFAGLVVLDIRDPANITQLGVFDTPSIAYDVQVVGDVAYVSDGVTGLVVLNVDLTLSVRATATITNDDTATADLAVTTNGGENGPVDVVFTVTLSQVNNTGSAITFGLDDLLTGSAMSGTDYTAIGADAIISIADGESTGTLTVVVTDDALLEVTETIDAQISNSSNAAVTIGTATASANIADDDTATLSIADVTVAEGGGLLFTVMLDNAVQGAFDVNASFTDGSAAGGADYDNSAVTLNFVGTAGETQQFTVTTTDDFVVEADEDFTVNLSATNALVTASDTATGTITSDDVPSVSVDDVLVAEGTDVVFTVSLDQAPVADVTVDVITTDGTAVAPGDYAALSTQTLTFIPGGALSQTVTVSTIDDDDVESDETFVLDLSNVSGGVIADAQGLATLTSDDIDSDPDPTLAISPDGTTTSDDPIVFTFQFSETVSGFDINDITVQNGTARTFTAVDGGTFTLTVVPTASGAVTVSVAADAVVDAGNQGNAATSATVTSNLNPAVPVPIVNDIPRFPATARPTVTWQEVAGISNYEIWFARLFPAESRILQANSMVTTAEFTPPSDLDPGFYRYWIRAIDDTGAVSPWSTSNSFEVRPTLQNTDVRTFERRPTFSWDAVANAPGYEIFIRTVTGDIRVTDITQTSYTPTVDLAVGPIRWWIRTSDAIRNRGWSDVGLVDVRTNVVSASSTSIAWNSVSGAGRYILHVQNVDTGVVAVRQDQLAGTSYNPATPLASGNYRVWVKAINAQTDLFNSGLWSEAFNFSVSAVSNDASDDSILSSLQLAATDIMTTEVEANTHLLPAQQPAHSAAAALPDEIVNNAAKPVARTAPESVSAVEAELAFLDVVMGETIALGALIES